MNKRVVRIVVIVLMVVAAAIVAWKNGMLPGGSIQPEPTQEDVVGTGDSVDQNTGSVATGGDTGTGAFDPTSFDDPEIEELIQLLEELVQE